MDRSIVSGHQRQDENQSIDRTDGRTEARAKVAQSDGHERGEVKGRAPVERRRVGRRRG